MSNISNLQNQSQASVSQIDSINKKAVMSLERKDSLSKDAFLKLFISQLKYQDPLEPTNNNEFMAQMAQFTTVEQLTGLNEKFESFSTSLIGSKLDKGIAYLGAFVKGLDSQGTSQSGYVTAVKLKDGVPSLTLNSGKEIMIDSITEAAGLDESYR